MRRLLTGRETLVWSDKCGWVPEHATPEEIQTIADRMAVRYGPFGSRQCTAIEPALPAAAE